MSDYIRASDGNGEAVRAYVVTPREVGDMLLNVDSVLNWPHKGIATSGVVEIPSGELDPTTVSVFYYTLSGSMVHIDKFAPGYTDEGHSENEAVLLKPTTPWADEVAEMAEQPSLPAGGDAGQILTKVSSEDGDAKWEDAPEGGVNLVPKETPTGTVDGTNKAFTISQPYVAGSLVAYVNGLGEGFFVTETDPAAGEFEFGTAPANGSDIFVSYQFAQGSTNEADVLDGFHANATPTPNNIPVLDSNAKLPYDIAPTHYSTSEADTGDKWIDDKPIYRSVVSLGNLPNASSVQVLHNIDDIDYYVSIRGFANSNDGTALPLPYESVSSGVSIYVSKTFVNVNAATNRSHYEGYMVLEYTKTTD